MSSLKKEVEKYLTDEKICFAGDEEFLDATILIASAYLGDNREAIAEQIGCELPFVDRVRDRCLSQGIWPYPKDATGMSVCADITTLKGWTNRHVDAKGGISYSLTELGRARVESGFLNNEA